MLTINAKDANKDASLALILNNAYNLRVVSLNSMAKSFHAREAAVNVTHKLPNNVWSAHPDSI